MIHTNNNTGYVPESAVNEQVTVLNDAFNQYGISFTLSSLDYTANNNWFNNDSENAYKSALAISPSTTLNIYTTTAGGYLGYAYLPSQFDENSYMHGVVLHHNSLPNLYNWVYDAGDTGTHEVGHYLDFASPLQSIFSLLSYQNASNTSVIMPTITYFRAKPKNLIFGL